MEPIPSVFETISCNVLKSSSIRVFDSFFICILWLTSLTSNFQCQYIGTKYKILLPRELRGLIRVLISNVYMHVSKMYKFLRSRTLGVDREVFYIIQCNLFCMNFDKLGLNFKKCSIYIYFRITSFIYVKNIVQEYSSKPNICP